MKIGLFFGSFNPVHNGHLVIAGYMAEYSDLNQIWMIVSPHNPLKPIGTLLQDYHRYHLVELELDPTKNSRLQKSNSNYRSPPIL